MALIKVVKIKKIVDALIEYVRTDYNNVTDKHTSFLYRLLGDNIEGDYNFYTQSKEIFLRDDKSPRNIKTSLMFNKNTHGSPHVHIREASRMKGTFNSIGGLIDSLYENEDSSYSDGYRDSKKGVYEILVTSSNPLDTVLISEVIYTLLLGAHETLTNEFALFDMSLKEMIFQDNTNAQLYVKAIMLDTQQENIVPSIISAENLNEIIFNMNLLENTPITNPTTCTLTIQQPSHGTTDPVYGVYTVNIGQVVPLYAIPDTGYIFYRWLIGDKIVIDQLTYVKMYSSKTIIAEFIPEGD